MQSIENEMFPPSEAELNEIIAKLKQRLEDERYSEDWKNLHEELQKREQQLKELIIKNNAL
ncbi:hypothetical protein [Riemerella columbina]|uniref:hypothetical protein n=1 Tax=Riemerella columbina TaxID=103810 RepID=UPI00035D1CA5|nr:hypothetical protein [Riemerella columbina]